MRACERVWVDLQARTALLHCLIEAHLLLLCDPWEKSGARSAAKMGSRAGGGPCSCVALTVEHDFVVHRRLDVALGAPVQQN